MRVTTCIVESHPCLPASAKLTSSACHASNGQPKTYMPLSLFITLSSTKLWMLWHDVHLELPTCTCHVYNVDQLTGASTGNACIGDIAQARQCDMTFLPAAGSVETQTIKMHLLVEQGTTICVSSHHACQASNQLQADVAHV